MNLVFCPSVWTCYALFVCRVLNISYDLWIFPSISNSDARLAQGLVLFIGSIVQTHAISTLYSLLRKQKLFQGTTSLKSFLKLGRIIIGVSLKELTRRGKVTSETCCEGLLTRITLVDLLFCVICYIRLLGYLWLRTVTCSTSCVLRAGYAEKRWLLCGRSLRKKHPHTQETAARM